VFPSGIFLRLSREPKAPATSEPGVCAVEFVSMQTSLIGRGAVVIALVSVVGCGGKELQTEGTTQQQQGRGDDASQSQSPSPSPTPSPSPSASAPPPTGNLTVVVVDGCVFPLPKMSTRGCDPTKCMAVDAIEWDEENACGREVILGCLPFGGMTTDGPCYRSTEDGRIVRASGSAFAGRVGWERCSPADAERSRNVPCK